MSLVLGLGLEHSCPWPREVLSSEGLSLALALASDFFCVLGLGLGLEPCVLDSTSGIIIVTLNLWPSTVICSVTPFKKFSNVSQPTFMLFVAKNEASEVVCRASEQKVTDFMPEQVICCVLGKDT